MTRDRADTVREIMTTKTATVTRTGKKRLTKEMFDTRAKNRRLVPSWLQPSTR